MNRPHLGTPFTSRAQLLNDAAFRTAIEQQVEALIAVLDVLDGDPDMEPDHEDYDACDYGEPCEYEADPPLYAIDQSSGPINLNTDILTRAAAAAQIRKDASQ